jgi:predicted MFS family arabinose efflux permease
MGSVIGGRRADRATQETAITRLIMCVVRGLIINVLCAGRFMVMLFGMAVVLCGISFLCWPGRQIVTCTSVAREELAMYCISFFGSCLGLRLSCLMGNRASPSVRCNYPSHASAVYSHSCIPTVCSITQYNLTSHHLFQFHGTLQNSPQNPSN